MSGLEARGLVLRRGRSTLVDGVDLHLPPGRLLVVVGPNGAGKSSLVGLLSGAVAPTAGTVRLNGRLLAQWPPAELARQRAVLRQQAELGFNFTVREVAELGRSPHRGLASAAEDSRAVAWAMRAAQIEDFADRLYPTLSGGERQRAQLARVLAQLQGRDDGLDGRCLLLAEPPATLDLRHQLELLELAKSLTVRGCAVLAVLHDLAMAARYADEVLVMQRGRAVVRGRPAEVLATAQVEAVFEVRLDWRNGVPVAALPATPGSAATRPPPSAPQ